MAGGARSGLFAVGLGVVLLVGLPASGQPVPAPEPVAIPVPEPVVVTSPAPPPSLPLGLRLSGYIQADGQLYDRASQDEVDPSVGTPLNQTRFLIRRARLRFDLDHGPMGAALELDANTLNGVQVGVINAEVSVRARAKDETGRPWGDATIGLLRIPWGYEVRQRDQERFFLERSTMSRALFPGVYDLGVRVRGGWRFIELSGAVLNGNPLGDRAFPAADPNRAKDFVGRLGVSAVRRRVAFSVGLSFLGGTGFHAGMPETKDVLVWRDQNEDTLVQQSEIQVIPGAAATPSSNFNRFAMGADAHATIALPVVGALDVFGEATWAGNLDRWLVVADPVARGRDLRERGFVVGLVQELGAHVGVGVRYDFYDPDADASELRAVAVVPVDASVSTWTGTVAWRWTGLDRVVLEAQHFTNALGRNAAGAPATLGGDTIAMRAQVAW